jgi:putative DNA primase/helicase
MTVSEELLAALDKKRAQATPDNQDSGNRSGRRLVVHDASNVTPAPVEWLWGGRLALGKTTLVGGDPGLGKSQLSLFIAATVSNGGAWPCQEGHSPKRNVIIFCAEDGLADTIVPRLMAAGADLRRIKIVTAVTEQDGTGRTIFNLSRDLDLLDGLIDDTGDVGLVSIDPVDAYIGGGVDSHKNAAVRAVLEPISELADRKQTAILAVTHFSKQAGAKAMYRFIGSIAHIGSARVAFAVVADSEDKNRILLLHAKNNLAPSQKGLAFRIEQHLVADGVLGSSIHFESGHVANTTADQALAAENAPSEVTAKDDAIEFLRTVLADGPVQVAEVEREARSACLLGEGQPLRQSKPFRSARKALGVVTEKAGLRDGWTLCLPPESPQSTPKAPFEAEGASQKERAPSGKRAPSQPAAPHPDTPDDGLDLPADLDRNKGNGPHTWVSPDRRPALGPPGDSSSHKQSSR